MIRISFEVTDSPARLVVTELMPYPLNTVWLAQTEGLYVQQWWAPRGYDNVEVDITTAQGGSWRILQRDPEGNQFAFYGKVADVVPQERLAISITSEVFPETTLHLLQEFAARDFGGGVTGTVVLSTYTFDEDSELTSYLNLGGMDRLRDESARLDTLLAQLTS